MQDLLKITHLYANEVKILLVIKMSTICKTIIAKGTLNCMKQIYDVSYYVDYIESSGDSYNTSYKILEKLKL